MISVFQLVFPTTGPQPRHPPLLLTGFLGMVSLLSIATMKILRLPLSVSRAFAFRSASDTTLAFVFLNDRPPKAGLRSRILLSRCDPIRLVAWKQEALIRCAHPSRGCPPGTLCPLRSHSQLPWKPYLSLCPALRPRADFHARPLRRFSVAPAIPNTKASPSISISRLNHTASRPAAYA